MRVLIVDDEVVVVEEIVDSLTLRGLDVRGFSDPVDAVNIISSDPKITVVMTDLNMPGLNGLELSQRVLGARSDEAALEVVLLTGHADGDAVSRATRIGVFDLLLKPPRVKVMTDALARAHRNAVERRQRHRASLVV